MPPPSDISLSTLSGVPGDRIVITGRNLGRGQTGSEVRFQLREVSGAAIVAAPVDDWKNIEIVARVPGVDHLGSGGIADVWVRTPDGDSVPRLAFTVREPSPPAVTGVDPPAQLAEGEVTVNGRGFGLLPYGDAAVLVDAPGGPRATVLDWKPAAIRVKLPTFAQLGGPGQKRIRVHTLWGDSADVPVVVVAGPTVTGVSVPGRPNEPASFLPGDELVVHGSGFGSGGAGSGVRLTGVGGSIALEVIRWRGDQIVVRVPAGADLGEPGGKALVVHTPRGATAPVDVQLEAPISLEATPLAMLPLRLETRFSSDGTELLVRAIPDAIHRNDHQDQMSTGEAALGDSYHAAATPTARDRAWRRMVARVGRTRAVWIAKTVAQSAVATAPPLDRWNQPARTRLLPRRLYAFAYGAASDGAPAATAWSRPIPYELQLGPHPEAAPDGESLLDGGARWMVDIDAALANGMAIRLPLPEALRGGVKKVVVVGVETSLDAAAAAGELAQALQAHRDSRGIAFVPEGTPTNNTAERPSLEDLPDPGAPPRDPPQAPSGGSNAWWAARALGVPVGVFAGVAHADEGAARHEARRHMNVLVWPQLRYFLDHMMAPEVSPQAADIGRPHFLDWVRACGPLPVLRIGNQPYGLLAITPLGELQLGNSDEASSDENPLQELVEFLHGTLRPMWHRSLSNVPRVSDAPSEEEGGRQNHPLATALSLQPNAVSYRVRSVLGGGFAGALWRFMSADLDPTAPRLDDAWWQRHDEMARQALANSGLGNDPRLADAVFAANYVPAPGPIVQHGGAREQALNRNYLALLNRYGWRTVRDESYPPSEHDSAQGDAPSRPAPLLYLVARHSLLLARAFAACATSTQPWREEPEFFGVDEALDELDDLRDRTIWDEIEAAGLPEAPATGEVADVRASIEHLAALDVATLERLLAEALSLCATRLDAWMTSFASRRLNELRDTPVAGAQLCAYGFVEDVVPAKGRDSAGYIHTPSPSHAQAAAILASGYRSHAGEGGGGPRQPFGVDLSSRRVRNALSLLDGVRAGQPLGALLGYRFERGLHERGLARFVAPFREIAPLPVSGSAPPTTAVTSVAAQNVVDGLELHRRWTAAGRAPEGTWPGADVHGVDEELRALDDALDAIGDILLNEAVFHAVRGNSARARAALETAARPGGGPPELEAIYTPYAGTGVVHRLLALFPGRWRPPPGWAPDPALAYRAKAEPRLDAWAGRLLGDPKRVHFRVEYRDAASDEVVAAVERRLDQLDPPLSALDVVYAAAASEQSQLSEIEQRIVYQAVRTRPPGVPSNARAVVVGSRQPELEHKIGLLELMELAQAMRETIADARPVEGADLALPERADAVSTNTDELAERTTEAEAALRAADAALSAAIADGGAEVLRTALLRVSGFGVTGAVPLSAVGDTPADRSDLGVQAAVVQAEVRRRVRDPAGPRPADVGEALARLGTVFGPAFRALPLVTASAGDPADAQRSALDPRFRGSQGLQGGDRLAATRWFQRLTRVRDGARRLGDTLLLADMLGGTDPVRLEVDQLPVAPGDRWVALAYGDGDLPAGRVSIVGYLPDGPLDPAEDGPEIAGLKLEEFTEVLPARERTTGLAFHYDQPNASAPQAILLAVPPVLGQRWTLDLLRATVEEALELAKLRMVDLPALEQAGHFLPALYLGFNPLGVTVATDFKAGTGVRLA